MTQRRARWDALWQRLGVTPADGSFAALERQYASPGRHYHTLAHLDAVLLAFDQLREFAPDPDLAELALWMHDVVWEPMRDDCEQRSVEWATGHLPALPSLPALRTLILETRHHAAASVSPDAAVVRDADLSILAADTAEFDSYERAVRAEYAMLPTAQFNAGRARILRDFEARRPLYFTPAGQSWEPRARTNLARSLARLEG